MLQKLNRARRRLAARGPVVGRGGFTLVEIMMVLMILALGIIPVAIIQHQARREVTKSDLYTEGIIVAQTQLERIKGMGFGNAVADSGDIGNVAWVARVNNVSFGLDRVVVTATWQSDGVDQSLTVTDLMSMR
jgi:prepilin-type N-terminal cleavage/methylation domain-containing protein